MMGRASNYVVIPMAAAEQDGHAEFHINRRDEASSPLPMNEVGRMRGTGSGIHGHRTHHSARHFHATRWHRKSGLFEDRRPGDGPCSSPIGRLETERRGKR